MKVTPTEIKDALIVDLDVFEDPRGFFMETYHKERYKEFGMDLEFVQDNLSFSVKGTLRGLHYQYPDTQAKLVQALQGEVFDVAVDIRRGSPTFKRWVGVRLSAENRRQLFIPEGFAHGYCVLSETALFHYKCSNFYTPGSEQGILWNDPDLNIDWPVVSVLLSGKDQMNPKLSDIPKAKLFS
jgi:dTDP-4-dehydrorhamnose 3,5-epimerase